MTWILLLQRKIKSSLKLYIAFISVDSDKWSKRRDDKDDMTDDDENDDDWIV